MRKNITKRVFDEIQRLSGLNFTRKEIAKALSVSYDLIVKETKEINKQWKEFHNNVEEE